MTVGNTLSTALVEGGTQHTGGRSMSPCHVLNGAGCDGRTLPLRPTERFSSACKSGSIFLPFSATAASFTHGVPSCCKDSAPWGVLASLTPPPISLHLPRLHSWLHVSWEWECEVGGHFSFLCVKPGRLPHSCFLLPAVQPRQQWGLGGRGLLLESSPVTPYRTSRSVQLLPAAPQGPPSLEFPSPS